MPPQIVILKPIGDSKGISRNAGICYGVRIIQMIRTKEVEHFCPNSIWNLFRFCHNNSAVAIV